MSTIVTNTKKDRRPITLRLDHPKFRKGVYGYRRQEIAVVERAKDGRTAVREQRRAIDAMLTLRWKESRELPDEVRACTEVRAAMLRGDLEFEDAPEPAPAPKVKAASKTESSSRSSRKSKSNDDTEEQQG